jgi:hypothetical protein
MEQSRAGRTCPINGKQQQQSAKATVTVYKESKLKFATLQSLPCQELDRCMVWQENVLKSKVN